MEIAEDKEKAVVKPTEKASHENKDPGPETKLIVSTGKRGVPAIVGMEGGLETEQPELPKPAVVLPVPNSVKPPSDIAKQTTEINSESLSENKKQSADITAKKEPDSKMDNKNVKTVTGIQEKPPTPPVVVKTTTTTTTTTAAIAAAKKSPEQGPSLDDFSKMFAKETVDDSEATKLAKDMKDVEIDSLVKEGQDLVALLKRGRS